MAKRKGTFLIVFEKLNKEHRQRKYKHQSCFALSHTSEKSITSLSAIING